MMNVRNQGSKENVEVKFKEGICTELFKALAWKRLFLILLNQNGFENDCPERKSQKMTS